MIKIQWLQLTMSVFSSNIFFEHIPASKKKNYKAIWICSPSIWIHQKRRSKRSDWWFYAICICIKHWNTGTITRRSPKNSRFQNVCANTLQNWRETLTSRIIWKYWKTNYPILAFHPFSVACLRRKSSRTLFDDSGLPASFPAGTAHRISMLTVKYGHNPGFRSNWWCFPHFVPFRLSCSGWVLFLNRRRENGKGLLLE